MSSAMFAELIALSDARLQTEGPARTRNRKGLFIANPCVTPRSITALMIICGDCAGDRQNPRKTLLAGNGTCGHCGGRSYVLAAKLLRGNYDSK